MEFLMRLPLSLVFALFSAPALAFDPAAMTDAQRDAFRAEVRAYLLENPEVLMEAIAELEAKQYNEQVANDLKMLRDFSDEIFNDPKSWAGGNLSGDITVVEFVDYRCGYCRRAHDEVAQLVEGDGNVRLVMKEFPILGEESVISSRFAIATLQLHGSDAYKAVHDALIAHRGPVDAASLDQIAASAGLIGADIRARMASAEVSEVIAANQALAERLQISGTPTFVIYETMVRGYVPLDGMQKIVAQQRAKM
jgi:protein-disulfide isomerase